MHSKIIKLSLTLLLGFTLIVNDAIVVFAANPVEGVVDSAQGIADSVADNLEAQPENINRKLKNLGAFFVTMFDVDNSFNFLKDDMFAGNQCVRVELLALHRAKDEVSDYILDNFRTLTDEELDLQKQLYSEINAELIFVRNLKKLLNEDKTEYDTSPDSVANLKKIVEKKVPKSFKPSIPLFFEVWLQNYQEKFPTYLDCPNSWKVVVDRVDSIIATAEQVSQSASNFSAAFEGLGETIAATPGAFLNNSIDTIGSSFLESYNATRANFNSAIGKINTEFQRLETDRQEFIEAYQEINQARFEDLNGVNGTSGGLINISQSTLNTINLASRNQVTSSSSTQTMLESVFNDSSNVLILDNLIDLNANLEAINQTFVVDGVGLHTLTEEVPKLQCQS